MVDKMTGGKNVTREYPLTRLLPNMLTMMSLFGGLTAVRFAMTERWEAAALAIVIASVFDVLDGRVARMLNMTSKFGAELDSLADLTSFGVAPGTCFVSVGHANGSRRPCVGRGACFCRVFCPASGAVQYDA